MPLFPYPMESVTVPGPEWQGHKVHNIFWSRIHKLISTVPDIQMMGVWKRGEEGNPLCILAQSHMGAVLDAPFHLPALTARLAVR